MNSAERGLRGEELAAAYLERRGYRVLNRNFRTRFGEIDIIAEFDGYIVFVEVKSRKSDSFAAALESVDRRKRQRIIFAAQEWIQKNACELQPRFDVVETYAPYEGELGSRLNHIENAFDS